MSKIHYMITTQGHRARCNGVSGRRAVSSCAHWSPTMPLFVGTVLLHFGKFESLAGDHGAHARLISAVGAGGVLSCACVASGVRLALPLYRGEAASAAYLGVAGMTLCSPQSQRERCFLQDVLEDTLVVGQFSSPDIAEHNAEAEGKPWVRRVPLTRSCFPTDNPAAPRPFSYGSVTHRMPCYWSAPSLRKRCEPLPANARLHSVTLLRMLHSECAPSGQVCIPQRCGRGAPCLCSHERHRVGPAWLGMRARDRRVAAVHALAAQPASFELNAGESAMDFAEVARVEHLDRVEVELRRLHAMVRDVLREQQFQRVRQPWRCVCSSAAAWPQFTAGAHTCGRAERKSSAQPVKELTTKS